MENKETKETKENIENKDVKDNKESKDTQESKEATEPKENNEKKEVQQESNEKKDIQAVKERFSQENKDLLIKIINETIKKKLDNLEKRNKAESISLNLLNQNVEKIKSRYIPIYKIFYIIEYI